MNKALLKYMLTHVRMNSRTSPNAWSIEEVVQAFSILPSPAVDFDVWCVAAGESNDQSAVSPLSQPTPPTDDSVAEHNSRCLGILGAMGPTQVFKTDDPTQKVM